VRCVHLVWFWLREHCLLWGIPSLAGFVGTVAKALKMWFDLLKSRRDYLELKRTITIRDLADQMDTLEAQKRKELNKPNATYPDNEWIRAYDGEQPAELVLEALRLRRTRNATARPELERVRAKLVPALW
jgi:hypothetical protein